MQNLHDLFDDVLTNGKPQFNTRTGKVCFAVVGRQIEFDVGSSFPAITTKALAFGAVKGENLGFWRGYTNAADFRRLGCRIWDQNANETAAWLANPYRKGTDDLGVIYGRQWTHWADRRIAETREERERLTALGYSVRMFGVDPSGAGNECWLMERHINQLENALAKLLTDPSDRRIIVSGWNVAELDMMALPPCHMDYRWVPFDGATADSPMVLNLVMTIRSWDLFLGAAFNVAGCALFLSVMARLAGMDVGKLTIQATNAHIYEDHVNQVREQLTREHYPQPKLVLSDRIRPVPSLITEAGDNPKDEAAVRRHVRGVFERIEPEDIALDGYVSHAAIKAPMAA